MKRKKNEEEGGRDNHPLNLFLKFLSSLFTNNYLINIANMSKKKVIPKDIHLDLSNTLIVGDNFYFFKEALGLSDRYDLGSLIMIIPDCDTHITGKYSNDEDDVIKNIISYYPTNLQYSFFLAGRVLNRKHTNIEMHYYNKLRNRSDFNVLTTGSKNGFTKNSKNSARDKDGILPDQDLRSVDWMMKHMLELSKSDRKKILNFFK